MNTLVQLMENSLTKVWNEKNPSLRLEVIKQIYTENAVLYEMGEETIGYEAINNQVTHLVNSLPPDFTFTQQKPVIINKEMGRLVWGVGPKGQPPVQSGMDIALFENGKIKSLYVFLEK